MRKFEYVPAAITGRSPHNFLGVRYESNTGKARLWKRTRFNGVTVHYCPDRTLYFGGSGQSFSGLTDVPMDEFMVLSPSTNPSMLADAGYAYGMASPCHVQARTETRRNKYIKLFSDSGGFQLISGAADFIDMDELIAFYNRTIDYGIGLDMPIPAYCQDDLLMRMCAMMLDNNSYLRARAVPEVSIYDVSHGNTLPRRSEFLKAVLDHKKKNKLEGGGLAVGGIMQNSVGSSVIKTVVNGVVNLTYTLMASKGQYERYHVLGTTNSFFQFLYHILLHREAAPHITADSTSYVLPSANNLTLLNKLELDHSLITVQVPKDERYLEMQCSCPICGLVKYTREMHVNYLCNAAHSLYAINSQRLRIEESVGLYHAGKLSLDMALTEVIKDAKSHMPAYMACIRFVELAADKGFKVAFEKYKPVFSNLLRQATQNTLFDSGTPKSQTTSKERLASILEKYEVFHRKQRKGKS